MAATPFAKNLKKEFDLVERPPEDFFCPISLELLLEPQQTSCCGKHMSLEAVTRLREERKACPMCNSRQWSTVLDKYHRRRVQEVRVYCWQKENGCEWVGELSQVKRHDATCDKQYWECKHCGLVCVYREGEENHWPVCVRFPEPCPNQCEVGRVARCDMEQHRNVCPLEPVTCTMKEFGCRAVVPRRELAKHMEESELRHLTAMTMLNLHLTRELQQDLTERDGKIAQLQKDMQLMERKLELKCDQHMKLQMETKTKVEQKTEQVKQIQTAIKTKLNEQKRSQAELSRKMDEHKKMVKTVENMQGDLNKTIDEHNETQVLIEAKVDKQTKLLDELKRKTEHIQADVVTIKAKSTQSAAPGKLSGQQSTTGQQIMKDHTCSVCRVITFAKYDHFKYRDKSQFSDSFYVRCYNFRLCVSYYGREKSDIGAHLFLVEGEYDDQVKWPIEVDARLQLLNQLGDEQCFESTMRARWEREQIGEYRIVFGSNVIKYTDLERTDNGVQYVMNDSINCRVHITVSFVCS